MSPAIRAATPVDVPVILRFIRALAAYERAADQVEATEESLQAALFGPKPAAEALIAEDPGAPIGFAVFFHNFSTWTGRAGLYLEDLFVVPHARGRGAGIALLKAVARIAVDRNCARMEWAVLDWNTPAIDLYRSIGAMPMDEWTIQRLSGSALQAFAQDGQI